ncbi:hypothetical protein IGI04_015682 [Brassica rapa subsp. trilocularis]|uniref:Uncharacterized protein n=1 Tax=Brassica rapa subsp. trilocularis TaxID=1813537 RepID=A0ABQ7MR84_BRACM|nr:hypothetical protein IGI04_015682 [Brassica rapa subsp. trilocularis]
MNQPRELNTTYLTVLKSLLIRGKRKLTEISETLLSPSARRSTSSSFRSGRIRDWRRDVRLLQRLHRREFKITPFIIISNILPRPSSLLLNQHRLLRS